MAKTDFKTIDEYIATFPEETQKILEKVRRAVKKGGPEAEEVISYQSPAFKTKEGWVFYFSAYKKHYALACPLPFTVFTEFKDELAPYKISKSSIAFPLDQPVPVELIRKMAQFRAKENVEIEKAKKK